MMLLGIFYTYSLLFLNNFYFNTVILADITIADNIGKFC